MRPSFPLPCGPRGSWYPKLPGNHQETHGSLHCRDQGEQGDLLHVGGVPERYRVDLEQRDHLQPPGHRGLQHGHKNEEPFRRNEKPGNLRALQEEEAPPQKGGSGGQKNENAKAFNLLGVEIAWGEYKDAANGGSLGRVGDSEKWE